MSIITKLEEVNAKLDNGKTLIASAITNKGISTAKTDTLETMANKISQIQSGGSSEIKVSKLNLPQPKQITTISGSPTVMKIYKKNGNDYYFFEDSYMNAVNVYDSNFSKVGTISKQNSGYEYINKIAISSYTINYNDSISIFALDNNGMLYASYSYFDSIQNGMFKYSDCEENNNGLTNLTDIKQIFSMDKIGLGFAIDGSGKGYFIFPLGPYEYGNGYVYKSLDEITSNTIDFNNLLSMLDNANTSYYGEINANFSPVKYIEEYNEIIVVNDYTIYRFNYNNSGDYQNYNYNDYVSYIDSIHCNDTIHSYGINYPYMYVSNRYSNNYSVDLSNHYGSMTTISGMYGNPLAYTKIDNELYSVRKNYMYKLSNGNKVSYKNDIGSNSFINSLTAVVGEEKNLWFISGQKEIAISTFENDTNKHVITIQMANLYLNNNMCVDSYGNLIINNYGAIYKIEKDPTIKL